MCAARRCQPRRMRSTNAPPRLSVAARMTIPISPGRPRSKASWCRKAHPTSRSSRARRERPRDASSSDGAPSVNNGSGQASQARRVIHALTDDPQSTSAWDTGALGEERLGIGSTSSLPTSSGSCTTGGSQARRANIDHLAVTPTGVYVIDAKKYRGRPHLKVEGGHPATASREAPGRYPATAPTWSTASSSRSTIVRHQLDDSTCPVHGVLCFVEADWPLIGGAFTTRGVQALVAQEALPQAPIGWPSRHRDHRHGPPHPRGSPKTCVDHLRIRAHRRRYDAGARRRRCVMRLCVSAATHTADVETGSTLSPQFRPPR